VLKTAASLVQEGNAPYLFDLLVKRQNTLIFSVALGVGLSTWLGTIPLRTEKALCIRLPLPGMLRIVKKWSIKPLIYVCFAVALGLTVIVEAQVLRALQQLAPRSPSPSASSCFARWASPPPPLLTAARRARARTSSAWRGTWAPSPLVP
jgi:hypothetical protein